MKGLRAMGMVAAEDQATLRYSSDALQAALKDSQDTAAALAALFCFTFLLGLRVDDSTAAPLLLVEPVDCGSHGDWIVKPVIEQNTCYRMQWGTLLSAARAGIQA
ncbi:hypothetical protein EJB05_23165 [Eragrostis curvula]|uniref:Uncharacterized protein n=1 Tax=Eragrostis curvula TaxID=38414 RepID=A0A5J9V7D7_9POAL|nr:hypothetical protein EJB05_23165 [Eragrostis curvula]